jgi:hypothetical protein
MSTAESARGAIPIREVEVSAYTIPTDERESDGTLSWESTPPDGCLHPDRGRAGMGLEFKQRDAERFRV